MSNSSLDLILHVVNNVEQLPNQRGIVLIDLTPPLLREEVWNIFRSKLSQVMVTGDRP